MDYYPEQTMFYAIKETSVNFKIMKVEINNNKEIQGSHKLVKIKQYTCNELIKITGKIKNTLK